MVVDYSESSAAEALFHGGGELGERMRAIDWSRTSLGPVERWPQSLRTCLRIILTSRQPMFVWWGEELLNLYNDPYKAIVGGKHPIALGQPAAVVWREIWDQVGPRAARAMQGNEGTYDEALLLIMERHGYQEETYYTFSYSPVPNEQGGTGGIICANTDDTQRIIGARRLALMRDLAARTADTRSIEDACKQAANALEGAIKDLPFSLIYRAGPGDSLLLAGAAGLSPGHPAAPPKLLTSGTDARTAWPIAEILRSHTPVVVDDLPTRLQNLPIEPWGRPPTHAAVLPLAAPSQAAGRAGLLIVGLNPFRPFDEDYRTFVSLVAGQITASIANAEAYEQERRRAEALAEIDRAKTTFFSNISHEFRTPLTLMLGPQEDALASPTGALAGENLRAVHRNTLRLLKLVNNLLDYARLEAGRARAAYAPVDLAALTADLASSFRAAIERGGIAFEVDCPSLDELVYIDATMWEKVVLNLLSNAFKFTLHGRIQIRLRRNGAWATLRVADTGVGIADSELPRVFERFHRVEGTQARTHEGSGIGLALVHELVRMHGGEVAVTSRLGEGTTFTVRVPFGSAHLPAKDVVKDLGTGSRSAIDTGLFVEEALRWLPGTDAPPVSDEPALTDVIRARTATADNGVSRGGKVLLAEDNADMRDYVARLLRQHWSVETAPDGKRALEIARDLRPDVILTDVMMPNLDGFGLLRALRADPSLTRTPVILLSARAGEESRVEGLAAGADDYLVKPFSAPELLARVRVHMENSRLRRASDAERDRLRALLAQVPAIVNFLRGPDLTFEFVHPKALEFFGHRNVIGLPLLEALPEFADQEFPALLRQVLETGQPVQATERPVYYADGSGGLRESYWNFVYLPVRDDAGKVAGVMTFDIEVTEQVRARKDLERHAAALARANEEAEHARQLAESANRTKDEFLAMLGHELRNPLSPIVTSLQLMKMHGKESREQQVIERQVKHLQRLVDDLLDVSRLTRAKLELRKSKIELSHVVLRGVEIASPLLEQRRQRIDLQVPPEGLCIDADPDRLAQVVSNLVTNAAKYSETETTIHLIAARAGAFVRLAVRDSGIGLAPDMLDRVFDAFFQPQQTLARSSGGLGLGLAIVRSLVELHGGTVWATSAGLGEGSEFVIELPLATAPVTVVASSPRGLPSHAPPIEAPPRDGKRVLVVDDNPDTAELLAELFESAGHQARVAHDGPEALRVAAEFLPEVCLLDIGLPVMDGYELARHLRESSLVAPGARLIAVTGYGQSTDRQRSQEAGFDRHLVKPVPFDEIIAAIED